MARSRVPAHITESVSRDFGLEVNVIRSTRPNVNEMPNGDTKDGKISPPYKGYREVTPPGTFGSREGVDKMEPAPQRVDTVADYPTAQNDPSLHGAVASLRSADTQSVPFQSYASFQPRSSPLPRNASDELYLRGYGVNAADPRMSDYDSDTMLTDRDKPDRLDLYGNNRDGVLHNDNGHPGFKSMQGQIAAKEGVSQQAAGAILANCTRHASASAKKANPRLKGVK
jgi:hypothetical protein